MLRTRIIFVVAIVTCSSAVFLSGCNRKNARPHSTVTQPEPIMPINVDIQVFTQDLQLLGHWVKSPEYDMCWVPDLASVEPGWRPYTEGQWAYTDYGLTWVSDEPWGHITYHYGSWVKDPTYEWMWVPGQVWAPAWVAWRSNNDYIGWAPLPPRLCIRARRIGHKEMKRIRWRKHQFCFVDARHLLKRRLKRHVKPVEDNLRIIKQTFNITNININRNNRIVNNSISVRNVEKVTDKKMVQESLMLATNSRKAQKLHEYGKAVIYRPPTKRTTTPNQAARQAEQQRQDRAAARQAEQQKQKQAAARQAEQQRQKRAAARQAEQQRQKRAAAKQAEQQREKQAATRQAEQQRQKQAAARQAEQQREKRAAAKQAEQQRQKQAAARQAKQQRQKRAAAKQAEQQRQKQVRG
ncbi:MAG: DUF6600 domain-containing protein [Dehalococcoidales bacterium]